MELIPSFDPKLDNLKLVTALDINSGYFVGAVLAAEQTPHGRSMKGRNVVASHTFDTSSHTKTQVLQIVFWSWRLLRC